MKYEEIVLESLSIVGISVRTTNQDGKAMEDIKKLWKDFIGSNIADDIASRLSDDIYIVYIL